MRAVLEDRGVCSCYFLDMLLLEKGSAESLFDLIFLESQLTSEKKKRTFNYQRIVERNYVS